MILFRKCTQSGWDSLVSSRISRVRSCISAGTLALLLFTTGITCAAASDPDYATVETRQVIERMIEAHGGYDTWDNAPSISYNNTFFNPFAQPGENPWWYSRETINQRTRHVVQDWEIDKAVLVYDGGETWTTGWKVGNPPRFMVHFFYYFLNLPWLTQDDNVRLGPVERASLPGYDESFYVVTMTFTENPTVGKVQADSYRLFIHPETWLLQGYEYMNGYGALLDLFGLPDGELFGPILRIHDTYSEVDGLVFPARMHSMAPDGSQTWGHHIITQYDISRPFAEAWIERPVNAVLDTSSELRQSNR